MKTKTPRTERANRETIIDAARHIARRENWGSVTIRAIADELGYASPIIYEHFKNKEAALTEVVRLGFRQLGDALKFAAETKGSTKRLVATSQAYVAFARQSPELYEAMHGSGGLVLDPTESANGAASICELLGAGIQDWATAHDVVLPDIGETSDSYWSLLHGMSTLFLLNRLPVETFVEKRVETATRDLLKGWRSSYSDD